MKNLVATLGLLVAVAAGTGWLAYRASGDAAVQQAMNNRDALEWLRADFRLTDGQFAAIRKLHESYSIVCEEHCRAIQEAVRARNDLRASRPDDATALATAERRVQELRQTCETAIAAHVRQVAQHMAPDEGRRYLALVLPKIADFDHQAAPNLSLTKHNH